MATYFDEHADLGLVQQRRVAVLGEDVEAVVHATLLRDSGVDVHIGTSLDSPAAESADAAGLLCVDPGTAVSEADVIVVTRGEAATGPLLDTARPELRPGSAVVILDAVTLRYAALDLPADVDVVLVAPMAEAARVELEFAAGRGVPVVVAVSQDVSGEALALALSYAKAIGGTRAGAIGASVEAAAETALFGQYAVVGGAVDGLLAQSFDVLAAAGYPRDLAYVACVHALRDAVERTYGASDATAHETADQVRAHRAGGQRLVEIGLREMLEASLADVRAGRVSSTAAGEHQLQPSADPGDALAAAGRRVRRLMPWIAAQERDARHAR